jgi:hypothetical protein
MWSLFDLDYIAYETLLLRGLVDILPPHKTWRSTIAIESTYLGVKVPSNIWDLPIDWGVSGSVQRRIDL